MTRKDIHDALRHLPIADHLLVMVEDVILDLIEKEKTYYRSNSGAVN